MPYTKQNMPDMVKKMPSPAQDIWLAAFNAAFKENGDEAKAMAVAMAAVKKKYKQDDSGAWQMMESMQAAHFLAALGDPGSDDYGYEWDVQLIRYGMASSSGILWTREPFVAAMSKLNNAKVFLIADGQHIRRGGPRLEKSAGEIYGWITDPADTGDGAKARLHILKAAHTKWFRDALVDANRRGNPNLFGISVDVDGESERKMVAGKPAHVLTRIDKVEVDVVYNPTNEGKFLKMVAAQQADQKEEAMLKKLLAAIAAVRPNLKAQIDAFEAKGDAANDEDVKALLAAAMPEQSAGDIEKLMAAMKPAAGDTEEAKKVLQAAEAKFAETTKLLACAAKLETMLAAEAALPAAARARIKAQFEAKAFEDAQLQAAVKFEKEYLDSLKAAGLVDLPGSVRDIQVFGSLDRLQAASDRMFGVAPRKELENEVPFEGLRAAYVRLTGDTAIRGYLDPDQLRRLQAAGFDSGTWTYVLGNSMYRAFVKDFLEHPDYGLSLLISNERNAKDFRNMEAVKIAYFGDIPTHDPETGDWPDLGTLSDEEIIYAITQRGGLVGISRKMVINDDIGAAQKVLSRLPRACRVTRAKRAWNKLINNATYKGDSKAVFHADHGNLGSTALSKAELIVVTAAMRAQTEPGSGNKIYIPRKSEVLVIPTDLWGTATGINDTPPVVGTENQMFQYFGANKERIFECPFMTDATDWMTLGNPKNHDLLEIAYLNNQREPEMVIANNPTAGQLFYQDKVEYKIRMEDEVEILDYRNAYKEVVAG